ncbi:MAG: hypothetical protein KC613_12390, partial [Myxococcales bacterium]|nr:hypothetical protein [Myxococcales bacterium]
YCDGGLFAGDRAWDDDGDGVADRDYRGLRNLTAALDLAAARFPKPRRVVFAGSSGGAYGTIIGLPLVRLSWPDAELRVINDAGLGVAWGDEPERLSALVDELGAQALVPASCPDCLANGHLTGLVRWQLERDPGLRIAAISSLQDKVIADWFLRIGGEAFEAAVRAQTAPLVVDFPNRYRRFLADGDAHTALLGGIRGFIGDDVPEAVERVVAVGGLGVTVIADQAVGDWLRAFLAGDDPGWPDRVAR